MGHQNREMALLVERKNENERHFERETDKIKQDGYEQGGTITKAVFWTLKHYCDFETLKSEELKRVWLHICLCLLYSTIVTDCLM